MKKFKVFGDPGMIARNAITQMERAMESPFATAGALMPDAHYGYALPIGAVAETKGCVVPSWVGYDIGCGVYNITLDIKASELEHAKADIRDAILRKVPVGNNRHKDSKHEGGLTSHHTLTMAGVGIHKQRANRQMGTLGGGNHFIEVGENSAGFACITIHSGSRGLGHGIASYYMKKAAEVAGILTGNIEGHHPLGDKTPLGRYYLQDARYAQEWALRNREIMAALTIEAIESIIKKAVVISGEVINRNHNHVEPSKLEGHWIHRKGATHAEEGMMGVIPGNMRDGVFLVRGKGNDDWLCSSSHGAGRVMGRGEAKSKIILSEVETEMESIASCLREGMVDEAPAVYKDIFSVMEQQEGSVDIIDYIRPLVNVKG